MAEEKKDIFRTFICIEMPDEVIKEIARVQEMVKKVKFIGKLTELENLHLTLKFLGEIDSDKLKIVQERLRTIKFETSEIKLGKIGTFGDHGNPKLVWVRVQGKGIWDLQKKVDDCLRDLFKPEEKFMSHMTLARIKYVRSGKETIEHLKNISVKPVSWRFEKFKLKTSELKPLGPIYRDVEEYKAG